MCHGISETNQMWSKVMDFDEQLRAEASAEGHCFNSSVVTRR